MRMAYLILAHEQRVQLEALVERIAPPGSPDIAIVHADRRSVLWPELREQWGTDTPNRVLIDDPVAVRWGHWSQVAAIHRLIAAALAHGCDHAHLLSGADWPLVTRDDLVAAIVADPPGTCRAEAVAHEQEDRMQCRRLDAAWLRIDPHRNRLLYAMSWKLRRLSGWLDAAFGAMGIERSRPWGAWHKGSTWWSLPMPALLLLDRELRDILASGRLRGTVCSDEHVIPTILARAYPGLLADYRRYIDWDQGLSSPRVLSRTDLPAMLGSGAWFARKVSVVHDDFFLSLDADAAMALAKAS